MSFRLPLFVACAALAVAPRGFASEPPATPPVPAAGWSIGAGLGVNNPGLLSLSFPGVGGSGSSNPFAVVTGFSSSMTPPLPSASVVLEMRVIGELWLLGRLSGSFGQQSAAGATDTSSTGITAVQKQDVTEGASALALGVRQRAVAWGHVQGSWFVVLNGTYFTNSVRSYIAANPSSLNALDGTMAETSTLSTYGVGLAAGLAVDVMLVDNVFLRVSTPLANVGYITGVFLPSKTAKASESPSGHGFNAGIAFAPSLEVRLAW